MLEISFSAVSTQIFANKYSFCKMNMSLLLFTCKIRCQYSRKRAKLDQGQIGPGALRAGPGAPGGAGRDGGVLRKRNPRWHSHSSPPNSNKLRKARSRLYRGDQVNDYNSKTSRLPDLGAGDFSYDVTLTYTNSASFFRTHWTNDSQENPENTKNYQEFPVGRALAKQF